MARINAKKIISNAKLTVGKYVMGGGGGGQWDCSGFVGNALGYPGHPFCTGTEKQWILSNPNLPGFKDITSLVTSGQYDKLKPGDILIWNDPKTKGEAYGTGNHGHTAIVFDKNLTLIQARGKAYGVPCTNRTARYRSDWTEAVRPPGGVSIIKVVHQKP